MERCEQLGMKGTPERQAAIYHTFNIEDLIEAGYAPRPIRRNAGRALDVDGVAQPHLPATASTTAHGATWSR